MKDGESWSARGFWTLDSGLWTLMITTTTSVQEIDAQSDNRKRYSRSIQIFFLLSLPTNITERERKKKDRSIKKAKSPCSFEQANQRHLSIVPSSLHQITTPAFDAHMSRCIISVEETPPHPIRSPPSLSQRLISTANEKRKTMMGG